MTATDITRFTGMTLPILLFIIPVAALAITAVPIIFTARTARTVRQLQLAVAAITVLALTLLGQLQLTALPVALVLIVGCWAYQHYPESRYRSWLLAIVGVLSLAMALHVFTGFGNTALPLTISGTQTLDLWVNGDKGLAGIILLAGLASWRYHKLLSSLGIGLMGIVAIIGLALLMGYPIEAKWGHWLLVFTVVNLFFVALAEECFFRLIIQESLQQSLPKRWGALATATLSIGITSGLFVIAHGGIASLPAAILLLMAGIVYGWIYWRTRSVWAATLIHAGLNIGHILLLPYPLFR